LASFSSLCSSWCEEAQRKKDAVEAATAGKMRVLRKNLRESVFKNL